MMVLACHVTVALLAPLKTKAPVVWGTGIATLT